MCNFNIRFGDRRNARQWKPAEGACISVKLVAGEGSFDGPVLNNYISTYSFIAIKQKENVLDGCGPNRAALRLSEAKNIQR